MRAPLVILSLMLAAAGCVASQEDAPLAAADDALAPQERDGAPPAETASEPAPSSAPASSGAPGEASAEGAPHAQAPPPALATLPLSFEGRTQTFVCIPTALPACGAALASETERYVPEFDGAPRSAHVILSWTPDSPLTETLVLHIEGVSGCHEECHAMGASPLELTLHDIVLAEEWELTIHAFVPCQACDGHDKMVDPGQEFSIAGELLYHAYAE